MSWAAKREAENTSPVWSGGRGAGRCFSGYTSLCNYKHTSRLFADTMNTVQGARMWKTKVEIILKSVKTGFSGFKIKLSD